MNINANCRLTISRSTSVHIHILCYILIYVFGVSSVLIIYLLLLMKAYLLKLIKLSLTWITRHFTTQGQQRKLTKTEISSPDPGSFPLSAEIDLEWASSWFWSPSGPADLLLVFERPSLFLIVPKKSLRFLLVLPLSIRL